MLARPHRVKPLLNAITNTTPNAEVVFVVDPDDHPEHEAIRDATKGSDLIVRAEVREGGWAYKINEAVRITDRPLVFLGADDLEPSGDWLHQAEVKLSDTVQVVGVNDLIRRRRDHTTHFLMTREYALQPLLDGSRGPVSEAYEHNFCDDELLATAKHRGAYAYAGAAHVRHFHPLAQRAQRADDDETYVKGRSTFHRDRKRFGRRSHLWTI